MNAQRLYAGPDENGELELLALLLQNCPGSPSGPDGVEFLTPNHFSQQLAWLRHPAGKVIAAHVHNAIPRDVHFTQEVLVILRGKLRCDLYDSRQRYITSVEVRSGDVLLLASGGHGFEVIEDVEMYEVKQGPYLGSMDKTRFEPADGPAARKEASCGTTQAAGV